MKTRAGAIMLTALSVLLVASTLYASSLQRGGVPAMQSLEQIEQFLRTADVVGLEKLPPGNAELQKATLAQGETVHHAIFRGAGSPPDFKDSWRFEIAAYEIDKLLSLKMVPPTVERTVQGTKGSLQLWIETAMSEAERLERNIDPPDVEAWSRQIWKVRVFDQLIHNVDRSLGNLLYDRDWKVYMVGHDKTFEATSDLMDPRNLTHTHLSVPMMEALRKLNKANLTRSCSTYLSDPEIDAVPARRDKILEGHRQVVVEEGTPALPIPEGGR